MHLFFNCDNLSFSHVKMIQTFLCIGQLVEFFTTCMSFPAPSFLNGITGLWRKESNPPFWYLIDMQGHRSRKDLHTSWLINDGDKQPSTSTQGVFCLTVEKGEKGKRPNKTLVLWISAFLSFTGISALLVPLILKFNNCSKDWEEVGSMDWFVRVGFTTLEASCIVRRTEGLLEVLRDLQAFPIPFFAWNWVHLHFH